MADLTAGERNVLALIGEGPNSAEISARLVATRHTDNQCESSPHQRRIPRPRGQAAAFARRTRPRNLTYDGNRTPCVTFFGMAEGRWLPAVHNGRVLSSRVWRWFRVLVV